MMIDQVAAEMRRQCGKVTDEPWEALEARAKTRWRKRALAVISKMREPTEAMIDAYVDYADAKSPMEDVCRERWRAMIAAALKP